MRILIVGAGTAALVLAVWIIATTVASNQQQTVSEAKADGGNGAAATPTVPPPAPTTVPRPTATPVPTPKPKGAPAPQPSEGFNPNLFDAQSCGPEKNKLGGCIWDIGVHGSRNDMDNRRVAQVGILKGAKISWPKGNRVADSSPNGRCALVVLTPNSWFEDLVIVDGRMEIYDVDIRDIGGWAKTLAVQAGFEQSANYGCPTRQQFPEDFDVWGSPIPSPPADTPGFDNEPVGGQPLPEAQPTDKGSTDTLDGKERKATVDFGGQLSFQTGDAVTGFRITIGTQTYQNCYFPNAPGNGIVVDGVVHPWATESSNKLQQCGR